LQNNRPFVETRFIASLPKDVLQSLIELVYSVFLLSEVEQPHPQPPHRLWGGGYDVPHVVNYLQVNAIKVQVDAIKVQVDATKIQVDAIKVQIDAIKVQVDASKVQVIRTCVYTVANIRRGTGKEYFSQFGWGLSKIAPVLKSTQTNYLATDR
jgi:hypothetical protein